MANDLVNFIKIRGARENNLKGIDVDIPKNKLVVLSGLSGSGKSSLAYSTIYAEGQRRYMESLSAYARQFLQVQDKPDVDSIEGLSPTIAINQKSVSKNPRSNLATITEIYDYMRLLYARVGVAYSPATGLPIQSYTVSQIVDSILKLEPGTKFYLLSPIVYGRKGEHKKLLDDFIKKGYSRFKIDGDIFLAEQLPKIDSNKLHEIFVVVDRLKVSDDLGDRLPSSISTSLQIGGGVIHVEVIGHEGDINKEMVFSELMSCPESGFSLAEIEPRIFSFNSPYGACPDCDGLGYKRKLDDNLLVPDPNKSIVHGAIAPLAKMGTEVQSSFMKALSALASYYKFDISVPWCELGADIRNIIINGSKDKLLSAFSYGGAHDVLRRGQFKGLAHLMLLALRPNDQEAYYGMLCCDSCQGFRLKKESLCVKILGRHIGEILNFTVGDALEWFALLEDQLPPKDKTIASKVLKEIRARLGFLNSLGLDYLQLSRPAASLSGGESQRIRLASQFGSGLTGVIYVLDEPSIGLHQRDNDMLLSILFGLRDLGNTLLVVEHDEETIMHADWIVEIGPGAGDYGGKLVFVGNPAEILTAEGSITGDYLSGRKAIIPKAPRPYKNVLSLKGASANNLQNVDVDFPLGVLACVTGVSGGGKSSLVMNSLYNAVSQVIDDHKSIDSGPFIEGLDHIDKVVRITQSPIGRTPLSNPATYTGVFNYIRDWFASLPESKARGYKIGRYSFNVKGGRCEACAGDGVMKIEMHFLPDVYVRCDVCHGKRYNRETLEVSYKGKTIADVLEMDVSQALEFFSNLPLLKEKLQCLERVGLGYLKLGLYSTLLSGGEAQRIKLAKELSRRATGKTLYILDEPTTGLHLDDISKLLNVLSELVDKGNTVVVIEHNLHVIKVADYIIDVGPGSGDKGGRIVACGTPAQVADNPTSITGKYLKKYLEACAV